jgi:undecaprenyl-diphosphatase
VLLGLIQGPAELLPVSSSGHLALVPRLAGWSYAELPAHARKSFEVALHAGSAPAVALLAARLGRPSARELVLTLLPPALAGWALERPIEQRLGGTRSVAVAQVAAGAAMLAAERRTTARGRGRCRPEARDELAAGIAQAAALVPGVSRSGAAITACRLRGLSLTASIALAHRAALPVTVGAAALKGARLLRERPEGSSAAMAAGAASACVSALAALRLSPRSPPLRAIAVYRILLGLSALAVRNHRRAHPDARSAPCRDPR